MRKLILLMCLALYLGGCGHDAVAGPAKGGWEYASFEAMPVWQETTKTLALKHLWMAPGEYLVFYDFGEFIKKLGVKTEHKSGHLKVVNHVGSQGWELVNYSVSISADIKGQPQPTRTWWFKRPKG